MWHKVIIPVVRSQYFYFQSVPGLVCAFSILSNPSQPTTPHCVKAKLGSQALGLHSAAAQGPD